VEVVTAEQRSRSLDLLDWAFASHHHEGEVESGDLHLVHPLGRGVLVAMADGLGHGAEAAEAARMAMAIVERTAEEPLPFIMRACHQAIVATRGVVMSLVRFDPAGRMFSISVGNVEGIVLRADPEQRREWLVSQSGALGHTLPTLRERSMPVARGDVLALATDGIRPTFPDHIRHGERPQDSVDRVLTACAKGTDDALVLVARFQGDQP
jgi:negative regulator of sigma-B (phosphoserine phosphatase)